MLNHKPIIQMSLAVLILSGLGGCGNSTGSNAASGQGENLVQGGNGTSAGSGTGGSSGSGGATSGAGGNSASGANSAGSGGCVTFPRPVVGQIVKRELKDVEGSVSISQNTEIKAISNTSVTQHITGKIFGVDLDLDSTDIQKFTIANNFRDITKETANTNTILGIRSSSVTTFTPYHRLPIDRVCEGQTWNTTYTESGGDDENSNHSKNYTIEAVNVSKTTPAGTFNTFRIREEDVDIVGVSWIDIGSGYAVFTRIENTSGELEGTLEIIEKNF